MRAMAPTGANTDKAAQSPTSSGGSASTFGQHFDDLRRTLVRCFLIPFILICALWPFWEYIHRFLVQTLLAPDKQALLTRTNAMDTFTISLRLALYTGIVISIPWIVINLWLFVRPALYRHERRFAYVLMPAAFLLFLGGVAFALFFVLPTTLDFLLNYGAESIPNQIIEVESFYDLVFAMLFVMGMCFQIPLVVAPAIRFRIIRKELITKHRRGLIFTSLILGAVLTPTGDAFTMIAVAAPIYLLIEGGVILGSIWLARVQARARNNPQSVAEGFRRGLSDGDDAGGDAGGGGPPDSGPAGGGASRSLMENLRESARVFRESMAEARNMDTGHFDAGAQEAAPPFHESMSRPAPASEREIVANPLPPLEAEPKTQVAKVPEKAVTEKAVAEQAQTQAVTEEIIAEAKPQPPSSGDSLASESSHRLPLELRRRIDHYIRLRLESILDELDGKGAKSKDTSPDQEKEAP